MLLTDEFDFSKMRYNPTLKGFLTKKYPELGQVREFTKVVENSPVKNLEELDELLRFVIIFLSKDSPLFRNKDFDERKKLSLLMSSPSEDVRTSIELEDECFTAMVLAFFRLESNYVFEEWFSKKMMFHNILKLLRTPSADLDVGELQKHMKMGAEVPALRENIEKLETELFADKAAAKMVSAIKERRMTGYAEEYARKFDNKDIF